MEVWAGLGWSGRAPGRSGRGGGGPREVSAGLGGPRGGLGRAGGAPGRSGQGCVPFSLDPAPS